mmetsp:Transcript_11330/g.16712  ORF Transcript_11330/g.16712 Transcript_11330/m.16712 type:complete len:253 (-) Transcript_11330:75-833(-)
MNYRSALLIFATVLAVAVEVQSFLPSTDLGRPSTALQAKKRQQKRRNKKYSPPKPNFVELEDPETATGVQEPPELVRRSQDTVPVRPSKLPQMDYSIEDAEERQDKYIRESMAIIGDSKVIERDEAMKEKKDKDELLRFFPTGLKEEYKLIDFIPIPWQNNIELALIGGLSLGLIFIIAAGIGIGLEAFAVVQKTPLPENMDNIIVNVIEPAFTPALGVFLVFSIILGTFKVAQFDSRSDVVYTEPKLGRKK